MGRIAIALLLAASPAPALAQSWTAGDGVIAIPASVGGSKVAGATMTCLGGSFFLTLQGVTLGSGSGETPVALVVDGSAFATRADAAGSIAVPEAAVPALKTGKRLTVGFPAAGINIETVFALRGSSKALEVLAANCPANAGGTPAAEPVEAAAPKPDAVTLDFAAEVPARGRLEVAFTGPAGDGDWIGFATVGSSPSSWVQGAYAYVAQGSPQTLHVPAAYGTYEIRYVTKAYEVLLAREVKVTGPDGASLTAPETAVGASAITVDFSGPGGENAFVGVARAGAAPSETISRIGVYVAPVVLRAPVEAGNYEIRFVADGATVLAKRSLAVSEAPKVTLPTLETTAGAKLAIELIDAPRTAGDYIYLAKGGTPDSDYGGGYVGVPASGPASIDAPKEAGAWEIRYVVPSAGSYVALGRAPLAVK